MKRTAIALFSGGLDSTLAIRLMQVQGISVQALHFTSPFFGVSPDTDSGKYDARRAAKMLDVPLTIHTLGEEYLEMLRHPRHGYGKAINPCIDCHIYFLKKAGELLHSSGADFVITGEVMGQRPMSQRKDALRVVERDCGLEGLLLRPLSARFLEPTIPEKEGWVDRNLLPMIKGRSRKDQFRLASELGVEEYPTPAGGCLLTELSYASKVKDLFEHAEVLKPRDFKLLRIGRHFRIDESTRLIIGRNAEENALLESRLIVGETAFRWDDGSSPLALLIGERTEETLQIAGRILLRYTKAGRDSAAKLRIINDDADADADFSCCNNFLPEDLERYRV
jgi:tRNA U34 2-thiouridine synthase MnmA/TrmU